MTKLETPHDQVKIETIEVTRDDTEIVLGVALDETVLHIKMDKGLADSAINSMIAKSNEITKENDD